MAENQKKISPKLKIVIAVLLALLLLSATALTVRIVYLNRMADKSTTTVVPDNIIGEIPTTAETTAETTEATEATETTVGETAAPTQSTAAQPERKAAVIALYKGQPTDNEKFQAVNMLPGDHEEKYFAVKVTHSRSVDVYFQTVITEQTKNLADVLQLKVTHLETGKVLYDGAFAEMRAEGYPETFEADQSKETVAYYKIQVSLPTSTGNEHQAAKLLADLNWYVKDTGALDTPTTGDYSDLMPYGIMMCCSLALILILLFFRRREKEDDYAETK